VRGKPSMSHATRPAPGVAVCGDVGFCGRRVIYTSRPPPGTATQRSCLVFPPIPPSPRAPWLQLQLPLRLSNLGPSLAVVVPYRAVSFGLYFGYRERVRRYCHSAWSVAAASWLLAQGATAAGHLVSYPADTVRRRYLMQQHRPKPEWRYQTAAACWRGIATQEGAAGFFKGAGVSAVGSSLVGALVLVGFDFLREQMGAERDATEASASDV